eukprot:TRINITY_DN2275_c0_g2_i6.p1 TRINITY_DN2275_c0_g2~~TRINITY_DN2275_c0_g2_i6.p1  ORF type:complete len:3957 (-),score=1070.32 TRINITY_DN2275_c0_g2_i6:2418-14288(-)
MGITARMNTSAPEYLGFGVIHDKLYTIWEEVGVDEKVLVYNSLDASFSLLPNITLEILAVGNKMEAFVDGQFISAIEDVNTSVALATGGQVGIYNLFSSASGPKTDIADISAYTVAGFNNTYKRQNPAVHLIFQNLLTRHVMSPFNVGGGNLQRTTNPAYPSVFLMGDPYMTNVNISTLIGPGDAGYVGGRAPRSQSPEPIYGCFFSRQTNKHYVGIADLAGNTINRQVAWSNAGTAIDLEVSAVYSGESLMCFVGKELAVAAKLPSSQSSGYAVLAAPTSLQSKFKSYVLVQEVEGNLDPSSFTRISDYYDIELFRDQIYVFQETGNVNTLTGPTRFQTNVKNTTWWIGDDFFPTTNFEVEAMFNSGNNNPHDFGYRLLYEPGSSTYLSFHVHMADQVSYFALVNGHMITTLSVVRFTPSNTDAVRLVAYGDNLYAYLGTNVVNYLPNFRSGINNPGTKIGFAVAVNKPDGSAFSLSLESVKVKLNPVSPPNTNGKQTTIYTDGFANPGNKDLWSYQPPLPGNQWPAFGGKLYNLYGQDSCGSFGYQLFQSDYRVVVTMQKYNDIVVLLEADDSCSGNGTVVRIRSSPFAGEVSFAKFLNGSIDKTSIQNTVSFKTPTNATVTLNIYALSGNFLVSTGAGNLLATNPRSTEGGKAGLIYPTAGVTEVSQIDFSLFTGDPGFGVRDFLLDFSTLDGVNGNEDTGFPVASSTGSSIIFNNALRLESSAAQRGDPFWSSVQVSMNVSFDDSLLLSPQSLACKTGLGFFFNRTGNIIVALNNQFNKISGTESIALTQFMSAQPMTTNQVIVSKDQNNIRLYVDGKKAFDVTSEEVAQAGNGTLCVGSNTDVPGGVVVVDNYAALCGYFRPFNESEPMIAIRDENWTAKFRSLSSGCAALNGASDFHYSVNMAKTGGTIDVNIGTGADTTVSIKDIKLQGVGTALLDVWLTQPISGDFRIPVPGSPFSVTVEPSATDLSKSLIVIDESVTAGQLFHLHRLQLRDGGDFNITNPKPPNTEFVLKFTSGPAGVNLTMLERQLQLHTDGYFTATANLTIVGEYVVQIYRTNDNAVLFGAPPKVFVYAAPPISRFQFEGNALTGFDAGSPGEVLIVTQDTFGNALNISGQYYTCQVVNFTGPILGMVNVTEPSIAVYKPDTGRYRCVLNVTQTGNFSVLMLGFVKGTFVNLTEALSITVQSAQVSAALSVVNTFPTHAMTPVSDYIAEVQLFDIFGNKVTKDVAQAFNVISSVVTGGATYQSALKLAPGLFNVTFRSPYAANTSTIQFTYNGEPIPGVFTITVINGPAVRYAVVKPDGSGVLTSFDAGKEVTAVLASFDQYGNPAINQSTIPSWKVTFVSQQYKFGNFSGVFIQDNLYNLTSINITQSGDYELQGYKDDVAYPNLLGKQIVTVKGGFGVEGPGLTSALAGQEASFTISNSDLFGNVKYLNPNFTLTVVGTAFPSVVVIGNVTEGVDQHTYVARYTATVAQPYKLYLKMNGTDAEGFPIMSNGPKVFANGYSQLSVANDTFLQGKTAGEIGALTIAAKDVFGNSNPSPYNLVGNKAGATFVYDLTLTKDGSGVLFNQTAQYSAANWYNIVVNQTVSTEYNIKVFVMVDGVRLALNQGEFNFTIKPDVPAPSNTMLVVSSNKFIAGRNETWVVQPRDRFNNTAFEHPENLTVVARMQFAPFTVIPADHLFELADGLVQIINRVTLAGAYTVDVTMLNNQHIHGSPFSVTGLYSPKPKPELCFVSNISSPVLYPDEFTSYDVYCEDRFGNLIQQDFLGYGGNTLVSNITNSSGVEPFVKTESPGTGLFLPYAYRIKVGPATFVTNFTFNVYVNGIPISQSPFMVRVLPGVAVPSMTAVLMPAENTTQAGLNYQLEAIWRDKYKNPTENANEFNISSVYTVGGGAAKMFTSRTIPVPFGISRHVFDFNFTKSGVVSLQLQIDGQNYFDSRKIEVKPGPIFVPNTNVDIQDVDISNPLPTGGYQLVLSFLDAFYNAIPESQYCPQNFTTQNTVVADIRGECTPPTAASFSGDLRIKKVGNHTIQLFAFGIKMNTELTVSIFPSAVNIGNSMLEIFPPGGNQEAGVPFAYRLTLRDGFQNLAYNANGTLMVNGADTNQLDRILNATNTGPGVWNGTYTAKTVGPLKVFAAAYSAISSQFFVNQAPIGPLSRMFISNHGNQTAGAGIVLRLELKDLFGNGHQLNQPGKWPLNEQGGNNFQGVRPTIVSTSDASIVNIVYTLNVGANPPTYEYTLNFTTADQFSFSVLSLASNTQITNSPLVFNILPAAVALDRSFIKQSDQPFNALVANKTSLALIDLRDVFNNRVNGNDAVHFDKLQAVVVTAPVPTNVTLERRENSVDSVVYLRLGLTMTGRYRVRVAYDGHPLNNAPVVIDVVPDILNTARSFIDVVNDTIVANFGAGLHPVIVINTRDQFGNNVTMTETQITQKIPIYLSVIVDAKFEINSVNVIASGNARGRLLVSDGKVVVYYQRASTGTANLQVQFGFASGPQTLGNPTLTVVPATFSLAKALFENFPAAVGAQTAGVDYMIQMRARDKFENPINYGGEIISVVANSTANIFANTTINDFGNGYYNLTLNAKLVGDYETQVIFADQSRSLGSFSVIANVIDHRTSRVTFVSNVTVAGTAVAATIDAFDAFGNVRTNGDDTFQVTVLSGDGMGGRAVSHSTGNKYVFNPFSNVAGLRVLKVALNDGVSELVGSRFSILVNPAATSVPNCESASPSNINAGDPATFFIQTRDQFNNIRSLGGDFFTGEMTIIGTANKFPLTFVDANNGTFYSVRSFTRSGTYSLSIKGAGDQNVPVAAGSIVVHPRPETAPQKSKLLASPWTYTVDSPLQYVNVTTFDAFGNQRQFGNDQLVVNMTWTALPTQQTSATIASTSLVHSVYPTGSAAFDAPASGDTGKSATAPVKFGSRALLQSVPATPYDATKTTWNVTDHSNGKYTVWFGTQVSGLYTVQVLLNSQILGSNLPVTVHPGAVVATNTLVWGDGLNQTQLQNRVANLFVQARDQHLNYLDNHDAVFRASLVEVGNLQRTVAAENPSPEVEFGRFKIRYQCPHAGEFSIRIQFFPAGSTQAISVFNADPIVQFLANCPLGYSRPSDFVCQVCQQTFYANLQNQLECSPCPDPISQTSPTQATSVLSCVCREQFYDRTATGCKPCPTGADCAGLDSKPIAKPGYWVSANNPEQFLRCANPDACPGGQTAGCATGYTGRLCGDCQLRFYKLSGKCLPCPDNSQWIIILVVIALFFFCVGLRAFAQKSRSYSLMGIALNNIQLMALFGTFSLNWPGVLNVFFDIFSLFLFNVELTSPECAIPLGYWDKWMMKLALPFIVVAMMMIVQVILTFVELRRLAWFKKRREDNPDVFFSPHSAYEGIWAFIIVPRMDLNGEENLERSKKQIWIDNMNVTWNAILVFISMAYALVTPAVLEIFVCSAHEDGVYTMDVAPSIQCGEGDWLSYLPISIIGIFVFCIGMPVFVFMNLKRAEDVLETPSAETRYGSLFMKYKLKYYYWEVTMMLRKGLVFFSQVLFAGNVLFQAVLAFLILLACLELQLYLRPFFDKKHNTMEFGCLMTSLFLLLTGILFYADKFGNSSVSAELAQTVIIIFAIAAMVFNLFTIAVSIFMTVTRKKAEMFTASNSKNLQRRLQKAEAVRRLQQSSALVVGNAVDTDETTASAENIEMEDLSTLRTRMRTPTVVGKPKETETATMASGEENGTGTTPGGDGKKGWSALRSHVQDFNSVEESSDGTVKMSGTLRLRAETINSMAQAASVYATVRGRSGTVRGRSGTVRGRSGTVRGMSTMNDPLKMIEKQNQAATASALLHSSEITYDKLEKIKSILDAEKEAKDANNTRSSSSSEGEPNDKGLLVDTSARASKSPKSSPLDSLKSLFVRDPTISPKRKQTTTTTTASKPKQEVEIQRIEDSDEEEEEEEEEMEEEEKEEVEKE